MNEYIKYKSNIICVKNVFNTIMQYYFMLLSRSNWSKGYLLLQQLLLLILIGVNLRYVYFIDYLLIFINVLF